MKDSYFKTFTQRYGYIFEWYYILVVLGYMLTLATKAMRPGIFATLLLFAVMAEQLLTGGHRLNYINALVLSYIGYNLLSVIWLKLSGLPVSVFLGEFAVSILPIAFFFAGRACRERLGPFYDKFVAAVLIVGISGIILYIWAPQFYIDYSFDNLFISKADAPTMRVRMNSTIGCTLLAYLGTAGMMAGAYFLAQKKVLKGVSYIALCLVTTIMSNQRSALVSAGLVLIFINYLIFFRLHLLDKKYFTAELICMAVLFFLLCILNMDIILKFWWRLISLPTAVSERSEQWVAAVNNMYSTWFGNGLGANGHRALGIEGTHVIADGGLVKLYCEEGILGFSLFIYILILTIRKGLSDIRQYYVELGIIAVTLLQSIGSNVIAFQLATPIFWFAAGRIHEES